MTMHKQMSNPARAAGFTLVELMVVVLIVGILSAISYPGYRSYVVRTQRGAAKACLAQYAQLVERYYTTNLTYVGSENTDNLALPGCANENRMSDNYTFRVVPTPTATAYTVEANRTGTFELRDRECGDLSLNQAGTRGVGSPGTVATCW